MFDITESFSTKVLNNTSVMVTFNFYREDNVTFVVCYRRTGELDDRGSGVRFPARSGNFSLLHRVHTGSGAQPASYSFGTGGCFPGGRRPGREADHSPSSSTEVKNAWRYTSTPSTSSRRGAWLCAGTIYLTYKS